MASKGISGGKTPTSTSQSTSKTSSTSAAAPSKPSAKSSEPSDSSIHKAWGGQQNFMHSYGLKVGDSDDHAEAKAITQAFKDSDRQAASSTRGKR